MVHWYGGLEYKPKTWILTLSLVWPNSNAVGIIGAFLGGGSGLANGRTGYLVDHCLQISIITASGKSVTLGRNSTGEEAALFAILRGAGHGLGIITSLTLRAFPLTKYQLTENKVWRATLIFPPPAIGVAASLFIKLQHPHPSLTAVIAFIGATDAAPVPGAPMIVVSFSWFGPTAEAEAHVLPHLTEEIRARAVNTIIGPADVSSMNAASAPFERHGGVRELYAGLLRSVHAASIEKVFDMFAKLKKEFRDTTGSYVVVGGWSTEALLGNEKHEGRDKTFFRHRDRGLLIQVAPSFTDPASADAVRIFGETALRVLRTDDGNNAMPDAGFANNIRFGQDLGEIFEKEMVMEIKRVKNIWDPKNLFYSPVAQ